MQKILVKLKFVFFFLVLFNVMHVFQVLFLWDLLENFSNLIEYGRNAC